MDTETIAEPIKRPKYHSVNSQWPEGTRDGRDLKPTPQEAISAAKRLYRKWMGKPYSGKWGITSGRRHTYPMGGVFYVNPDHWGGGWHELVHSMSHYVSDRLSSSRVDDLRVIKPHRGHGLTHAFVEREMIRYVVERGWHLGGLKRERKAKPPVDAKQVRYSRVLSRIELWERREKRAKNALKKLRASKARYERVLSS